MAQALGIERFMVPGVAAGLSAYGGLVTDIRGEETATLHTSNRHFALHAVNRTLAALHERARRFLERAGVPEPDRRYEYAFQARYKYQSWEIEAPFAPAAGAMTEADVPALSDAFHAMHERLHTIREDDGEVEFTTWTVRAIGTGSGAGAATAQGRSTRRRKPAPSGAGARSTSARSGLSASFPPTTATLPPAGAEIAGPALIDSDTTTILLLAGTAGAHGCGRQLPHRTQAAEGTGMAETTPERFDPLLMAVLSRRLEAIIREMSNTVMRASALGGHHQ